MAEIKWIKLNVDMFDNSKIKFIRKLPSGNDMVLFWVMLLTKAGKSNSSGFVLLTENIPYSPEMLANEFDFELNLVKMALDTFIKLNMVEIEDSIYLPGWSDHQNIDGLEKIREQNRKRVAEHRLNKKQQALLLEAKPECNVTGNVTGNGEVTEGNADVTQQNKNKNKNKNKDINIFLSDSMEYRLAEYLKKHILNNNPNVKVPDDKGIQKWCKDIDLMLRVDKREHGDIKRVIEFCQKDSFWKSNILSTNKLREKYDQLFSKMNGGKESGKHSSNNECDDEEQRLRDIGIII